MYYFLDAELYYTVYLLIIFALTALAVRERHSPTLKERYGGALLLCLFMTWFIGNRPIHTAFYDMLYYAFEFVFERKWHGFDWNTENRIFDNLFAYLADGAKIKVFDFFKIMAALYFIPMYFGVIKIIPNHKLLAFLIYLGGYITFSFGTNGMKNGVGFSFALLAIAYHKNLRLALFFLICAWGFHHAMNMIAGVFILATYVKNTKWYFYAWVACFFIALLHIETFQGLLSGFADTKSASYLSTSEESFTKGFRLDFIIYSAMPILIGYYLKFKCEWENPTYDFLLRMYIGANSLWLLCMYASFTNRIASMSWFFYPLVLTYPGFMIEDKKNFVYKNRNLIIMGHLFFTMFMYFVLGK